MKLHSGKNEISFRSQGCNLSAHLYTPKDFDIAGKYPTVIFSPPFNQVKEQTGAVYGQHFAERGYAVLVFDHLGYGDSEGEVRNYENANIKMESIRDGISFLCTLPCVDQDKLFGLGVCASGGYMTLVAVTDKRLKAVASVSGMLGNKLMYLDVMDRSAVIASAKAANQARQQAYQSGEPVYMDALGYSGMSEDELAAMDKTSARYEGYDFYMTERAGSQTYPNYTFMTPANIMEMNAMADAYTFASVLYTPFIGIVGSKAMAATDTGPFTERFFEAASEPKEFVKIEGASHVSLYDIHEDVTRAVDEMDRFFEKHASTEHA